jgi:hypothetical protein
MLKLITYKTKLMCIEDKTETLPEENIHYISFTQDPVTSANGGKFINFSKLNIQTPVLSAPMDFRIFSTSSVPTFILSVEHPEFLSLINTLDTIIVDRILQNSMQWINKTFPTREAFIATSYNSLVKYSDNYPPYISIKFKFNKKDGTPLFSIFDPEKMKINVSTPQDLCHIFKRGICAKVIISCSSIYYIQRRFGVSLDVVSIKLCNTVSSNLPFNEYLFIDEEDDCV